MILRLLVTTMIVLAIAKFYLHDSKQTQQTKPAQRIEDVQKQLNEIKQKQEQQTKKQLEDLNL